MAAAFSIFWSEEIEKCYQYAFVFTRKKRSVLCTISLPRFFFQAVFERLVDIICDKMSESLDSDPTLNTNKGTRLDNAQPSSMNCNC